MTEIQRLLTATIDDLNTREKRDNRPRFSISFIRKHPGLFVAMYAAWLATLASTSKSALPRIALNTNCVENRMPRLISSRTMPHCALPNPRRTYNAMSATTTWAAKCQYAHSATLLAPKTIQPTTAAAVREMATNAKAVEGLEKLMNARATTAPRVPPPPPKQGKTKEEITELMKSDKYRGKPSQRDPAVVKEVNDWFKAEAERKAAAK